MAILDRGVDDFLVEPAATAQLDELFGVAAAELTEAFGFCTWTLEDARSVLEPPEGTLSLHRLVRDPEDGTAVQWWAGLRLPGDPFFYGRINTHPRLDGATADRLASAGWDTLSGWIREVASGDAEEVEVHSGCPAPSAAAHRRLEAAGFTHQRTFWEMWGPVTEKARSHPPVDGLTVESTPDERIMHRVLSEAFVGHWGFEPMPFEDWLAVERSSAGHDAGLWRLARIDGEPAAAMILTRRAVSDGALYVSELATLSAYRGRGIASALLAHAFEVAAAEQLAQVSLHVDSANANDAPSVYRRAGFEVRSAFDAFTRLLRTGAG